MLRMVREGHSPMRGFVISTTGLEFAGGGGPMRLAQCKQVALGAASDVNKNHTLAFAAGLSYYFLLGIFPALIAIASVVAFLPIPDLFNQILTMMSRFVPPDSMGFVRQVAADVIT